MPPHTGPWDFLMDVPLVMYGPGVIARRGRIGARATVADLAPTTAALVRFAGWPTRDGRVLGEALVPDVPPPRLVLTMVWDGAGDNLLEAHPQSWPYLRSLRRAGVSFENAIIGSTPSNTPPIHATVGTGAWPRRHGIVSVTQRSDGEDIDPWTNDDPAHLELPTLGDLYDRARENVPEIGVVATVNWHLGMVGHGSGLPGADADLALLLNSSGVPYGTSALYQVPPAAPGSASLEAQTKRADLLDGRADGEWAGHSLDDLELRYASPAYTGFQQEVLEATVREHGFGRDQVPDLLYVNFKQPDAAAHKWGINSSEVGDVLRALDDALRVLVASLDRDVGRRRWALMITADHGMMPYPEESGGWAASGRELKDDVNAALDNTDDGRGVIDRVLSQGAYVHPDQLRANDLTLDDVARWMSKYTLGQSVADDQELPARLEGSSDELLFDAIVVRDESAIGSCTDRS